MSYVEGKYKFSDYPHREMWIFGDDDEYMYYCTDGYHQRKAKLRYKPQTERDPDRCGMYFNAVFPDGGKHRIYLYELVEYR